MQAKQVPISATGAVAALSGGLAAAIMVAAAGKHLAFDGKLHLGTSVPARQLLPMMLVFLSPLPLLLTTVGFGKLAGAVAVLVGAVTFGTVSLLLAADAPHHHAVLVVALSGVGFGVVFGGPALLLGSLARQPARPATKVDPVPDIQQLRPEERAIGRVLAATIAVAAVLVALGAMALLHAQGGYTAFLQDLAKQIQPILDADPNGKKVSALWIARVLIWFGALTAAAECVCLFALNIWLAGRIAQTSGLFASPWPDLPRTLRVPRPLAVLAAVAFGLSAVGGLPGLVSVIVAGAIMAAFAFQGLAVVHQLTRGSTWRTPVLFSVYLALSVLPPLMLAFSVVGLTDAAVFFRDRQSPAIEKKPGPRKGPSDRSGPWS